MGLKVSKSTLARAINVLENSCKALAENPATASSATKFRLSGSLVEALKVVTEKQKKVRDYR